MEFGSGSLFFSSDEMEGVFKETFGPMLLAEGFSYAGKNRWTRQTAAEFKHLCYLYPFRPGAQYYPHGALSFDFVPRVERGKLKFGREPKDARVHLVLTDNGLKADYEITRDRARAKERCFEVAAKIVPAISRTLESMQTIADALPAFEARKAGNAATFYYFPETALAYAFVLAKVGERRRAEKEFVKLLEKQPKYFPAEIREAFEAVGRIK